MYAYEWDKETGGYLLTSKILEFSKEPRPVYFQELDILGFNQYFEYDSIDTPYLWAESNNYWYRGEKIAVTHGGNCYEKPCLEVLGSLERGGKSRLFPIDIARMVKKNERKILEITNEVMLKLRNTYNKYKRKVDVFYVAFSGGKDSIVTLDLVKRTLPPNSFKVVFGDTRMEFPDTYKTVSKIEAECRKEGIEFLRAYSHLLPEESWRLFGPPSQTIRWCCSVHKTVPQILLLRQVTNKPNFVGMAFTGVRADESARRASYEYVSRGEKHSGQYSCNPILKWGTAELYLYMFSNNLTINEAYKKGNRRVGCLVCPGASGRYMYAEYVCYGKWFNKFINIIKHHYEHIFNTDKKMNEFIIKNGWMARRNGRDLALESGYSEGELPNKVVIKVKNPRSKWDEWIKTVGVIVKKNSMYVIDFQGQQIELYVKENGVGIEVSFNDKYIRECPQFVKVIKTVFRRAACCVGCNECVSNCQNGYIKIDDNGVHIDDKCTHCLHCHNIDKGCLVYDSIEKPRGSKMIIDSLNRYSNHGPKIEWIVQYFTYKEDFCNKHTLGTEMYPNFKKFLIDTNLSTTGKTIDFSDFASLIERIGLNNETSWALMLTNLACTRQINWYVNTIDFSKNISRERLKDMLEKNGVKKDGRDQIILSLKRFLALPFGKVGMGKVEMIDKGEKEGKKKKEEKDEFITRLPYNEVDPRVVLYALYKMAEAREEELNKDRKKGEKYQYFRQWTLDTLMKGEFGAGVSPVRIFGLTREKLKEILINLATNYPQYISVSFSLDLGNVNIKEDKGSSKEDKDFSKEDKGSDKKDKDSSKEDEEDKVLIKKEVTGSVLELF